MSSFQSPPFPHRTCTKAARATSAKRCICFNTPSPRPALFFRVARRGFFWVWKGLREKKTEPAMKFLVMSCSKTREFQDTFPKSMCFSFVCSISEIWKYLKYISFVTFIGPDSCLQTIYAKNAGDTWRKGRWRRWRIAYLSHCAYWFTNLGLPQPH